ncbi:hypothetical protein A8B76_10525 [Roseovarius indicus]|nr:hypothetical protein A8B76_10525 [Roseovarius indicus]
MPPISFELRPGAVVKRPSDYQFSSMSYDAQGELLLSWTDGTGPLMVEHVGTEQVPIALIGQPARFLEVQRFSDGRWLLADMRCRKDELNCQILSPSLDPLHRFKAGDAIEQIIIDQDDNIWVGYFDENPTAGLLRFSADGQIMFDFGASSGLWVLDVYAMHLDRAGSVWAHPYPDFCLAKISGETVTMILDETPVKGARALLAGGNHVAFFGSYEDDNAVFLLDLSRGAGDAVALTLDGKELETDSPALIATQGETASLLVGDKVCALHLSDLIRAVDGK